MIFTSTDSHASCFELDEETPRLSLGCGVLMALVIAVFRLASPTHSTIARTQKNAR
jgi:hypothetical protein